MTRDQKKALRHRRQEAERRQRERRDARLRAPLECAEGEEMLATLEDFFNSYPETRDVKGFSEVLRVVEHLNVLKIDVYKYAFAASIECVCRQHPDMAEEWRKAFPDTLRSVGWLFKGFQEDWEIQSPSDVEQAFVAYRMTKDDKWLDYTFEVVKREGELSEVVASFLDLHSQTDDTLIEKFEAGLGIRLRGDQSPDPEVRSLIRRLSDLPDFHTVAYVVKREQTGQFIIGVHAPSEALLRGAPLLWGGLPVSVQKITPAEAHLVDKYKEALDTP